MAKKSALQSPAAMMGGKMPGMGGKKSSSKKLGGKC